VEAQFSGITGTFAMSTSNTINQVTVNHPTQSGDTLCNGPVPIGTQGGGNPYPSQIVIGSGAGLTGTIEKLTVTLNNLQTQDPQGLAFLLVSPTGSAYEFLGTADGSASTIGSGVTLTLSDTGSMSIPTASSVNCSSTPCLPTDDFNQISQSFSDTFPAPAPGTFSTAPPTGSATFATMFGGQGAPGSWLLYLDNRESQIGTLGSVGSWCLNFTMQAGANATTTTASATPNPALTTQAITMTATVSATPTVNAGTVTFTADGSQGLGTTSTVSGGSATLNVPAGTLSEGTHHIAAAYSGTNTGTIYGISTGTFDLRVDRPTTEAGTYQYCNPGSISVPGNNDDSGAAAPYPSNITVAGLPGTVRALTITLNSFTSNDQPDLMSLLVHQATGKNLDFFSQTGSGAEASPPPIILTFDDTASSLVNTDLTASGTFKPTSLNISNTYPACPPNALDCSSPPVGPPLPSNPFTPTNKAATAGTAILGNASAAGVFGGTTSSTYNGNGVWSLYMDDLPHGGGRLSTVGSWCLNFTQNPPVISVSTSHSGGFVRNGTGTINVTVSNAGPGPTGGVLTVSDTLPTGLSATSFAGAPGWSCSGTTTVSCTNSTPIAAGSNEMFSFTVGVGTATGDSVSNTVTASGGGSIGSVNGTDPAAILVTGTVLTINKSHTDPFNQGQTGATYTITVANTGASGTNSGPGITRGTIQVTDNLPSGLTATGFSGSGWTCESLPSLSCTLNSALAVGTTASITLTVNVSSTAGPTLTNTGMLTATTDQIGSDNSSANLTNINTPDLTVAKTHSPASFTVNDTADTIPITVTNSGSAPSSGTVTVTDTLPTGLTFVSSAGTGWSACTAAGQVVTCTTTNAIANSGTSTVTLTVSVAANTASPLTNGVSVACTCTESNTSNNSNTNSIPVIQIVAVTLQTSPPGLQVSGDGGTTFFTAPHTFQFAVNSTQTILTTSPQAGTTGTQYVWQNWSDSGAISHTITVPSSPETLTATFQTQYLLTTLVAPNAADGSITPVTGYVASGSTVPVTATPNSGFAFVNFTGGLTGTTNPQNLTVTGPTTVTANFQVAVTNISTSVNVSLTGIGFSRVTRQYSTTMTVTNTSSQTITAPISVALANLSSGVTFVNATGTYNGNPYIRVLNTGTLAPGQSVSVALLFTQTGSAPITFTEITYSGL
jgi:uncharacterized repeat protein (TIGR01451 family)